MEIYMTTSLTDVPKSPRTEYGTFSLVIDDPDVKQEANPPKAKESIKSGIAKVGSVVKSIFSTQPKIGEELD